MGGPPGVLTQEEGALGERRLGPLSLRLGWGIIAADRMKGRYAQLGEEVTLC